MKQSFKRSELVLPTTRIFGREKIAFDISELLAQIIQYSASPEDYSEAPKKGIYIYGPSGSGKTFFITELLKSHGYDAIVYNASDIRNKALFQTIDNNNLATLNVFDMFHTKVTKIAVVMDEIDGMNSGDKGGIDALIRLVRQKKTKKQRSESTTSNPIICIGNHKNDKKIRELMKACHVFELPPPTSIQMVELLRETIPVFDHFPATTQYQIKEYIQGDLNKFKFLYRVWCESPEHLTIEFIHDVFQVKVSNEDTKTITCRLLNQPFPLDEHAQFMNETDRTTVALLWHENVAKAIAAAKLPETISIPFYLSILGNICFADYIGRITFQNQIWQFNEMCSLIKTFYNNRLLHDLLSAPPVLTNPWQPSDIEFTKVLTKYSTEFNNQGFLYGLCQQMNMDKSDVIALFQELKLQLLVTKPIDNCNSVEISEPITGNTKTKTPKPGISGRKKKTVNITTYFGIEYDDATIKDWMINVHAMLSHYELDMLDIKRIYRFLDIVDKTTTTTHDFNERETEL